jgi:uncharacterized protein involved in propanediol utilization
VSSPSSQQQTLPNSQRHEGGKGTAIAHHGEVLQGVFETAHGTLLRAVVSLPYPRVRSCAAFWPSGGDLVEVQPSWKTKARAGCVAALEWFGEARGGLLVVDSDIPVERGLGSSTADVVSAIEAVAQSVKRAISPEDVARLAVRAERASDGIMFGDRAVLYANRSGAVLEDLGGPLPQLEVLGFDIGGDGVNTLAFEPARYLPWEVGAFRALRGLLRRAVALRSAPLLAQVATASARINQRHLPNAALTLVERSSQAVGALGYQVAHSGKVVGLLFDPADPHLDLRAAQARSQLSAAGVQTTWRFRTPQDGPQG